jgi:hypothetical protein
VALPGAVLGKVLGGTETGAQWVVALGGVVGFGGVIGMPGLFGWFGVVGAPVGLLGVGGVLGVLPGAAVATIAAAPRSTPDRVIQRCFMVSSLELRVNQQISG